MRWIGAVCWSAHWIRVLCWDVHFLADGGGTVGIMALAVCRGRARGEWRRWRCLRRRMRLIEAVWRAGRWIRELCWVVGFLARVGERF